jgi:hypothetical protein
MMNPLKSAWRQVVLQWIGAGNRRGVAHRRSQKPTRLGVESLETRALLSATSPSGDEPLDFYGFPDDAPGGYASPYDQDGPLAGSWSDDSIGSVYDEPLSLDWRSPRHHAAWAPPEDAPLRATTFAPQVVYVVRLVRVTTPSPLRASAPTTGLGSSLSGGQTDVPSAASSSDKPPLRAKAPVSGGSSAASDSPLNIVASTVAERSTAFLPIVSSQSQTTARDESPLLRALESRDAVFRALAASTANHGVENSQALKQDDADDDGSVDMAADDSEAEADDANLNDRAFDDALESTSLRDATEQQADAIAAILGQLAAARPEHRSQTHRADAADLQPPTEPAVPTADGESIADERGGMILLRATAGDAILASADDVYGASGEAPTAPVGMQAEIGLYQAFGVAAGEAVDDVPAAAAMPVKPASPQGGADDQNGRNSTPAPTASTASPEAVVTASVVSLTVAASGLRTRSYPQMRRERR